MMMSSVAELGIESVIQINMIESGNVSFWLLRPLCVGTRHASQLHIRESVLYPFLVTFSPRD